MLKVAELKIKGDGQMKKLDYRYVTNEDQLKTLLKAYENAQVIAVDIETMGKDPLNPREGEIRLLQIAASNLPTLVVDWRQIDNTGKTLLKNLLEGDCVKVFHNGKFDIKFLSVAGINIESRVFDTLLAAGLMSAGLESQRLKLEEVTKTYLKINLPKEQQKSDWGKDQLTEEQLEYAVRDVMVLLQLREKLILELEAADLAKTAKLEFESLPAIVQMELNGIRADEEKLIKLKEVLDREKEECIRVFKEYFLEDINPNSSNQLIKALASLGIQVSSTKHEVLSELAPEHEVVRVLLEYKDKAKKLQFAEKIPENINSETGRIYSNYYQLGAATGRLSCTDFNLQQVPNGKEFRQCFIPGEGNTFVIADYSQMQIRIAAEISKDYEMIEAYQRGDDLHTLTASLVSGKPVDEVTKEMRTAAKALNFGMLFGMGAKGLVTYAWSSYGVKLTEKEAGEFIDKFFHKYAGLKHWQKREGRKTTKESRTIGGRRRLFEGEARYTQLVNNPIQGTESDILKKALSILPIILKGTNAKLIACVHDEIIVECKEDEGEKVAYILQAAMEKVGEYFLKEVPVVAEATVTKSWAEK